MDASGVTNFTYNIGTLKAGESGVQTFSVKLSSDVEAGAVVMNQVSLDAGEIAGSII